MIAPLTYRDKGASGTQMAVLSHTAQIASISKKVASMTAGSPAMVVPHPSDFRRPAGAADSCEEAKARVEANWRL